MNNHKFLVEVESHRSRLFLMSQIGQSRVQELMGWSAQQFGVWDHYLSYHDLPKIQSSQELQSYGYSHQKSLLDRLLPFYGESIYQLSNFEKEELMLVIQDLNSVETHQKSLFFESMQKSLTSKDLVHFESLRTSFSTLETVLDVIDTTHFRAKEMGSSFSKASIWLEQNGKKHLCQLSDSLEQTLVPHFGLLKRI